MHRKKYKFNRRVPLIIFFHLLLNKPIWELFCFQMLKSVTSHGTKNSTIG